jgi:hypothetical protein
LDSIESGEFLGQVRDSDWSRKTIYCEVSRGYTGSIWSKINIRRGFTLDTVFHINLLRILRTGACRWVDRHDHPLMHSFLCSECK